jgi:hypothetical protein
MQSTQLHTPSQQEKMSQDGNGTKMTHPNTSLKGPF